MLKHNVKRTIGFLLTAILLLNIFSINISATDNSTTTIDENIAVTVAFHFVWENLEKTDIWNETTSMKSIVPFYDANDAVNAYCINLITEQIDTGYIIISADINKPLIQEYSYTASIFKIDTYNNEVVPLSTEQTLSIDNSKIYYYGPLNYSMSKYDTMTSSTYAVASDSDNVSKPRNENLISYLKQNGLISIHTQSSTRSGGGSNEIISPITYLQELYPDSAFTKTSGYTITPGITGYDINGYNACSLYGAAAILQYYLGSNYTVDGVADICKEVAQEEGYAEETSSGTWNYYIDVGKLAPFVKDCIAKFPSLSKKASSSLFSWATGTDEISADRPILLNIATSEQYSNHTVVAFGWEEYESDSDSIRFYTVKDGYVLDTRYVNYEEISISYITKVIDK